MEWIEGNKLIAESPFSNERHREQLLRDIAFDKTQGENFHANELATVSTFKYHTSWEWLMPVVEKIGEYHWPEYWLHGKDPDAGEWDDTAYPRTFGMRDKEGNYMVRINASQVFSAKTLIEATWLAVIDFIQWYNSQTLK
jgi:hypothetical protein